MGRIKNKNHHLFECFRHLGDIFNYVLMFFLVIITGFLMCYFTDKLVATFRGEKQFFTLYTIVSPSMVPNVNVYDIIFNISPNSPDSIEEGDIITFESTSNLYSKRMITHRVIDIIDKNGEVFYKTKGDNNMSPDSTLVPYDNIVGNFLFKIPALGRAQFFLRTPLGIGLLITFIILFFAYKRLKELFSILRNDDYSDAEINVKANHEYGEEVKKELDVKEDLEVVEEKEKLNFFGLFDHKETSVNEDEIEDDVNKIEGTDKKAITGVEVTSIKENISNSIEEGEKVIPDVDDLNHIQDGNISSTVEPVVEEVPKTVVRQDSTYNPNPNTDNKQVEKKVNLDEVLARIKQLENSKNDSGLPKLKDD